MFLPHMTDIHVSIWNDRKEKLGKDPPILLVHGSGPTFGEQAFERQRPLARRYRLLLVDRRGFGESPGVKNRSGDFTDDANDIVELLEEHCEEAGAHIVGHSYGAIGCMLAAANRPSMVRSLTVIEPPLFNLVRNHNELVTELIKRLELNFSKARDPDASMSPYEYWTEFTRIGGLKPLPAKYFRSMPEKLIRGIRTSMTERPPWEANIHFEELSDSQFSKLVVSGGWKEAPLAARKGIGAAYMQVCKVLQAKLHAELVVIDEADHCPQELGSPFNNRLIDFLAAEN